MGHSTRSTKPCSSRTASSYPNESFPNPGDAKQAFALIQVPSDGTASYPALNRYSFLEYSMNIFILFKGEMFASCTQQVGDVATRCCRAFRPHKNGAGAPRSSLHLGGFELRLETSNILTAHLELPFYTLNALLPALTKLGIGTGRSPGFLAQLASYSAGSKHKA